MKKYFLFTLSLLTVLQIGAQQIDTDIALQLSRLPLSCIAQQWPNKTSHLSDAITDHKLTPAELHPAFFGCLDWHSSVHGHWLLVKILKSHPDIPNKDSIITLLDNSFRKELMNEEAAYFNRYTGAKTWERTYGWAWLLKLDEELLTWNHPKGQQWHETLQPLTQTILKLWKEYLPKQTYPNRTGVHPNTAFGLAFALDWARAVSDSTFERMIINKSKDFYLNNRKVPAYFEPDGSDFFSPSLLVADLMRRILTKKNFTKWFNNYYDKRSIDRLISLPVVSDRNDYQIVHLDGLSFSRAWCMKGIARNLPVNHPIGKLFKEKSNFFIYKTLPNISHDNYEGSHWLATFAFFAMQ
ncbi:MAG: DUF2891 domain-containing protein [Paludibacter sp.]|nr:DUF2891 domain-containing protein [Paludibacter sp.]